MRLIENQGMYIYDGEVFSYELPNGEILRLSLEALLEEDAIEEIFRIDENGEPVYPLIFENITEKNSQLIKNSTIVLCLKTLKNGVFEGIGLAVVSEDWWVPGSLHVNELSIVDEYQNLGLGTLLMRRIEELAFVLGKNAITLQCYKDEEEDDDTYLSRENFYRSLGYIPKFEELNQLMVLPLIPEEELSYRHLR